MRTPPVIRGDEKPMKRALILALSGLLATAAAGCAKKEAPAPPPPDVKAATVLQKDVPIYVEAIGQTRGSTEIEVRARVEGFLESVDFKEGSPVKKGQLLYTIDPRPFQATLAQAEGRARRGRGAARARQAGRRPLRAAGREERHLAAGVRHGGGRCSARRRRPSRRPRPPVDRAEIDLGYTQVTAPDGRPRRARPRSTRGRSWGAGRATLLTHISQIDHDPRALHGPRADYLVLRAPHAGTRRDGGRVGAACRFELVLRRRRRCTRTRARSSSWTATSTRPPARS